MNQTFKSFIVSLLVSASVCGISYGIYAGVENSKKPNTTYEVTKLYMSSTEDEGNYYFSEFYCEFGEDGTYTDKVLYKADIDSNSWTSHAMKQARYFDNGKGMYDLKFLDLFDSTCGCMISTKDSGESFYLSGYDYIDRYGAKPGTTAGSWFFNPEKSFRLDRYAL